LSILILTLPKMYPEMEIVDCRANMKANFLKFLKKIQINSLNDFFKFKRVKGFIHSLSSSPYL